MRILSCGGGRRPRMRGVAATAAGTRILLPVSSSVAPQLRGRSSSSLGYAAPYLRPRASQSVQPCGSSSFTKQLNPARLSRSRPSGRQLESTRMVACLGWRNQAFDKNCSQKHGVLIVVDRFRAAVRGAGRRCWSSVSSCYAQGQVR